MGSGGISCPIHKGNSTRPHFPSVIESKTALAPAAMPARNAIQALRTMASASGGGRPRKQKSRVALSGVVDEISSENHLRIRSNRLDRSVRRIEQWRNADQ